MTKSKKRLNKRAAQQKQTAPLNTKQNNQTVIPDTIPYIIHLILSKANNKLEPSMYAWTNNNDIGNTYSIISDTIKTLKKQSNFFNILIDIYKIIKQENTIIHQYYPYLYKCFDEFINIEDILDINTIVNNIVNDWMHNMLCDKYSYSFNLNESVVDVLSTMPIFNQFLIDKLYIPLVYNLNNKTIILGSELSKLLYTLKNYDNTILHFNNLMIKNIRTFVFEWLKYQGFTCEKQYKKAPRDIIVSIPLIYLRRRLSETNFPHWQPTNLSYIPNKNIIKPQYLCNIKAEFICLLRCEFYYTKIFTDINFLTNNYEKFLIMKSYTNKLEEKQLEEKSLEIKPYNNNSFLKEEFDLNIIQTVRFLNTEINLPIAIIELIYSFVFNNSETKFISEYENITFNLKSEFLITELNKYINYFWNPSMFTGWKIVRKVNNTSINIQITYNKSK